MRSKLMLTALFESMNEMRVRNFQKIETHLLTWNGKKF